MQNNNIIIAVDNGNSHTKTIHHNFVSGVTVHDVRPPITTEDIIKFNNKFYTLTSKRGTYKKDKTQDEETFVLTLFSVCKELESLGRLTDSISLELATGLPPGHFILQGKFKEYFKSFGENIRFEYNDKAYTIKLNNIHVFPQAYAAVAKRGRELAEYSKVYIIDIGGYTVDVLLISDGKPDLDYCVSLNMGTIVMYNEIKRKISVAYDYEIDDSHIIDSITGNKKVFLPPAIIESIKSEAQHYAEEIIGKLKELKIDLRINPSIFLGGGSLLLQESLKNTSNIVSGEFITDVSANAKGYFELARIMSIKGA